MKLLFYPMEGYFQFGEVAVGCEKLKGHIWKVVFFLVWVKMPLLVVMATHYR